MIPCTEAFPFLEAYVDDELSPEKRLEISAHLTQCPSCEGETLILREMKVCLSADAAVALPADFSARLCARLGEECRREDEMVRRPSIPSPVSSTARAVTTKYRPLQWKTIAPLAAAAAAVLSFGASQRYQEDSKQAASSVRAAAGPDSLVDLLVAHHTQGGSPEVIRQQDLGALEPEVGIPIRLPDLNRYGAHFVGASRLSLAHSRAASLHYDLNGRRVTLYVYDPESMPLRTLPALHPTVVGNDAVFVGHRRGYSIATCEKKGVGYAVAADLSDEESAELVAAVDR